MSFGEALQQYWQFAAFVMSGIVAFFLGRERTRWKIDAVGGEVQRAHTEIEKLEKQLDGMRDTTATNVSSLNVALGQLQTQMLQTHELLREIKQDLRNKEDKT